jgi:hypothetical protein
VAGVDADPHLEAALVMGSLDPLGLQPGLGQQVEAGEHGRSASSSRAVSAPKAASRLSPAYCRTLPPRSATRAVNDCSAESMMSSTSSGSMVWLSAVEPTTSRNSTDTWRRRGGATRMRLLLGEQRRERGIDDRAAEHRRCASSAAMAWLRHRSAGRARP